MVTRAAVKLTPPISDRDHLHGPRVAPVTLVEYGDYECPYCGQAYFVLEALLQSLGNRLLYAFRHFPLATAHPHAQHAAEAAEAAGAQDEFWQMHRSLFYNQDALEDDDLMQYASDIGLDLSQFVRDMTEHRYAARVREDFLVFDDQE